MVKVADIEADLDDDTDADGEGDGLEDEDALALWHGRYAATNNSEKLVNKFMLGYANPFLASQFFELLDCFSHEKAQQPKARKEK